MAGSTYSYSGKIVTYTVPTTGVYDIVAYVARGRAVTATLELRAQAADWARKSVAYSR